MRALVFLVVTGVSLLLCQALTDAHIAYSVLMSVCLGAIVSTVTTPSGRKAGRRILEGIGQGWGRAQEH